MDQKVLIIILTVLVVLNIGLLVGVMLKNFKASQKCENNNNNNNKVVTNTRIVGGKKVSINSYPFMAGIIIKKHNGLHEDMLQCGCSIIATHWIVTAAHCLLIIIDQNFKKNVVCISSTQSMWIKGKRHDVVDWIHHEKYDDLVMSDDIALMRVRQPFSGHHEKPIPIANAHYQYKPNTEVMVTGWGLKQETNQDSEQELRGVVVKILNQEKCMDWYSVDGNGVTDEMFCAGYPEGGKDACQFDSGGPITDKNLLIGIVSWGIGCGKAYQPGVYTRIGLYEKWITETAKKLKHPLQGAAFKSKP